MKMEMIEYFSSSSLFECRFIDARLCSRTIAACFVGDQSVARRGAVPRKAGWAPRKNREVTMDYRFVKFQGTFPEKQQTRLIPICIRHTPAQLILYVDSKKNWKPQVSCALCGINLCASAGSISYHVQMLAYYGLRRMPSYNVQGWQ